MSRASIQTDAAATNRSLTQSPATRGFVADPPLMFWRRLLDTSLQDAKKCSSGLPTARAVLARWWIAEYRPTQADREGWQNSMECACHWLSFDVEAQRQSMLQEVDEAWKCAGAMDWCAAIYVQRATILGLAGEAVAIARQFMLPLVSAEDWDEVAGIDHDDPRGCLLFPAMAAAPTMEMEMAAV